jgi:hypothetical protein
VNTISPLAVALGVVAIAGIVSTWLVVGRRIHQLPATVAHHFDLLGRPDSWGKKQILWCLPGLVTIIAIAITLLALLVPPKSPPTHRDFEFLAFVEAYTAWMIFTITARMIDVGLGKRQTLGKGFCPIILGTLALVILIGSIYVW